MYAVVAVLSHLTHSPLVADKVQPQLLQVVYFRAKSIAIILFYFNSYIPNYWR